MPVPKDRYLTSIEQQLNTLLENGVDPFTIEENLKPCICGMPQVIAAVHGPVKGKFRILTRCTETDRKVCKVSKRLRIYRHELPKPEAEEESAETMEAVDSADASRGLTKAEAESMLSLMKADPNLTASEAREAVLGTEDAVEQAAGIA